MREPMYIVMERDERSESTDAALDVMTNVRSFSADAGSDAFIRLGADALSFIAAYFAAAAIGKRLASKGENSERRARFYASLVFAAVLTAVQLAHQTYVTVSFFAAYDDVTAIEKSGIAADYFYFLLKYGVLMFGAVAALFTAIRAVADKKEKNR